MQFVLVAAFVNARRSMTALSFLQTEPGPCSSVAQSVTCEARDQGLSMLAEHCTPADAIPCGEIAGCSLEKGQGLAETI